MALTAVTFEAVGGHSILGLQNSFFNSQIFLVVLLKYLKIVHLYGLQGRSRPFSEIIEMQAKWAVAGGPPEASQEGDYLRVYYIRDLCYVTAHMNLLCTYSSKHDKNEPNLAEFADLLCKMPPMVSSRPKPIHKFGG